MKRSMLLSLMALSTFFASGALAVSRSVTVTGGAVRIVQQEIEVTLNSELCPAGDLWFDSAPLCKFLSFKLDLPVGGKIVGVVEENAYSITVPVDGHQISIDHRQLSREGFNDQVALGQAKIKLIYQGPALRGGPATLELQ